MLQEMSDSARLFAWQQPLWVLHGLHWLDAQAPAYCRQLRTRAGCCWRGKHVNMSCRWCGIASSAGCQEEVDRKGNINSGMDTVSASPALPLISSNLFAEPTAPIFRYVAFIERLTDVVLPFPCLPHMASMGGETRSSLSSHRQAGSRSMACGR